MSPFLSWIFRGMNWVIWCQLRRTALHFQWNGNVLFNLEHSQHEKTVYSSLLFSINNPELSNHVQIIKATSWDLNSWTQNLSVITWKTLRACTRQDVMQWIFFTWHLTNMSKKTSSPSGCSELASRRPYREGVQVVFAVGTGTRKKTRNPLRDIMGSNERIKVGFSLHSLPCDWTWSVLEVEGVQGWLEVLTRKPGKGVMLTRWSSRRRAWELASSSRKWPGSWYSRSRSETATNRHNYYVCE